MKVFLCTLSLICLGCAPRAPIDRAAVLNKSVTKQVRSLNRFSQLPGVEDEQGQLTQATMEFNRDIGLVHDCLRDRGGIENPICRFDAREVEHRTEWIAASSGRLEEDVFHSTKANDRTKRKAKKAVTAIQAKAAKIEPTLGQGGLLIRRFSTAPPPPNMLRQLGPVIFPKDANKADPSEGSENRSGDDERTQDSAEYPKHAGNDTREAVQKQPELRP